jgi:predicted secreted hydrolase
MRRSLGWCFLLLLLPLPEVASFGSSWRTTQPGDQLRFPADHGAHPDYRTEWWYFTGHLQGESGRLYGFQLTFFRVGVDRTEPRATEWDLADLALAHFAVTDVRGKRFRYHEKANRSNRFLAGARVGGLHVFNEGWSATMQSDGSIVIEAAAEGDAIRLTLVSRKPPVLQGERGFSRKGAGEGFATYYYSLTRLMATGEIMVGGRREACRGLAWMDHEFGSAVLSPQQVGWDWFSIQLDNDTELMLFVIREAEGGVSPTSSGTLVFSDGRTLPIRHGQFQIVATDRWRSPRSGAVYPIGWRISIPALGIDLRLTERLRDQELLTAASTGVNYWEGSVAVTGRSGSSSVSGFGYVEMTGYDKPFRR